MLGIRRAAGIAVQGCPLMAAGEVRHRRLDHWRTILRLRPGQTTPIIITIIQIHRSPEASLPVPHHPLLLLRQPKLLLPVNETTARPRGSNVCMNPKMITRFHIRSLRMETAETGWRIFTTVELLPIKNLLVGGPAHLEYGKHRLQAETEEAHLKLGWRIKDEPTRTIIPPRQPTTPRRYRRCFNSSPRLTNTCLRWERTGVTTAGIFTRRPRERSISMKTMTRKPRRRSGPEALMVEIAPSGA